MNFSTLKSDIPLEPIIWPFKSAWEDNARSVYSWTIDGRKIQLLKVGNQLEYQCTNVNIAERIREIVNYPKNFSADQFISLCQRSFFVPYVTRKGKIEFSCLSRRCATKTHEIRLLASSHGDLIWQIFELRTRNSTQYFEVSLSKKSLKERLTHFKNLSSHEIVLKHSGAITASSQVDSKVTISMRTWAITLGHWGGRSRILKPEGLKEKGYAVSKSSCSKAGHAVIAVEGIHNKPPYTPFIHYIHLCLINNKPKVKLKYDQPKREFSGQTETWSRTRDLGERLLSRVQWEVDKEKEGDPHVFYCMTGSDSGFQEPVKVREFESWDDLDAYLDQMPDVESDMRPWSSFTDWKCKYKYKYIGNSESLLIKYRPFKSKIELYVCKDNCITYLRKRLSLAFIHLLPSQYGAYITLPKTYTKGTSSSKKAAEGQERVVVPFMLMEQVHMYDLTAAIQSQVGPTSWKLAEEEVYTLELQKKIVWEYAASRAEQAILAKQANTIACAENMLIGKSSFCLRVVVDGVVKDLDLTDSLRPDFKRMKNDRLWEKKYWECMHEKECLTRVKRLPFIVAHDIRAELKKWHVL